MSNSNKLGITFEDHTVHNVSMVFDSTGEKAAEAEARRMADALEDAENRAEAYHNKLIEISQDYARLQEEYDNLDSGLSFSRTVEELNRFKATAESSVTEVMNYLSSIHLDTDIAPNYFYDLFDEIRDGAMTAGEAITKIKLHFSELITAGKFDTAELFDSESISVFITKLDSLIELMNQVVDGFGEVRDSGNNMFEGITNSSGSDVTRTLDAIREHFQGLSQETQDSYQSVTQLIEALIKYTEVDPERLNAIAYALDSIGKIGQGTFGEKSRDNIISLAAQLQQLSTRGSINFSVTGLKELKVHGPTLKNLATYLPIISKDVDVKRLQALADISFQKLSEGFTVSRGTVKQISELADAVKILVENGALIKAAKDHLMEVVSESGGLEGGAQSATHLAEGVQEAADAMNSGADNIEQFTSDIVQTGEVSEGTAESIREVSAAMQEVERNGQTIHIGFNYQTMSGQTTLANELSRAGIPHDRAQQIAADLASIEGRVESVKVAWKDFADVGKNVSSILVKYVDSVGGSFRNLFQYSYNRQASEELGEIVWDVRRSGDATKKYADETVEAYTAIRGAMADYYRALKEVYKLGDDVVQQNGQWISLSGKNTVPVGQLNAAAAAYQSINTAEQRAILTKQQLINLESEEAKKIYEVDAARERAENKSNADRQVALYNQMKAAVADYYKALLDVVKLGSDVVRQDGEWISKSGSNAEKLKVLNDAAVGYEKLMSASNRALITERQWETLDSAETHFKNVVAIKSEEVAQKEFADSQVATYNKIVGAITEYYQARKEVDKLGSDAVEQNGKWVSLSGKNTIPVERLNEASAAYQELNTAEQRAILTKQQLADLEDIEIQKLREVEEARQRIENKSESDNQIAAYNKILDVVDKYYEALVQVYKLGDEVKVVDGKWIAASNNPDVIEKVRILNELADEYRELTDSSQRAQVTEKQWNTIQETIAHLRNKAAVEGEIVVYEELADVETKAYNKATAAIKEYYAERLKVAKDTNIAGDIQLVDGQWASMSGTFAKQASKLNELKVKADEARASYNDLATSEERTAEINKLVADAMRDVEVALEALRNKTDVIDFIAQYEQWLDVLEKIYELSSNGIISIDWSGEEFASQINSISPVGAQGEGHQLENLKEQYNGLYGAIERVLQAKNLNAAATERMRQLDEQHEQTLKRLKSATDINAASEFSRGQAVTRANEVLAKGERALSNYTKAQNSNKAGSREAYQQIQETTNALSNTMAAYQRGDASLKDLTDAQNKANIAMARGGAVIRANGDDVRAFSGKLGEVVKRLSYLVGTGRLIMAAIRSIRKMISTSVELNTAMTQMQVVTRESDEAMKNFGETAAESAKRVGASINDFVSSATTFARLGYTLDEASSLAEYTTMLQNIGDIDTSEAQDAITSIFKAFSDEIDISKIESVMDKLVTTGNNFPISVQQIAEGMTNASSTLAAAGNTFEQSVALLTAANTTVQNAAKASTGLRTIAARIRNTKEDLDELGESMEKATYDELVQSLTDAKVALTDVNGEYRSTYDIMADIAAQWDSMSSMQQAALATALSGTRQQAIFYSIIEQFKEASGAMDAMANSAGALDIAYSTYMDSAQAHINQFKAVFQEFSSTIANSKVIGFFADMGATIIKGFDKHPLLNVVALTSAIVAFNSVLSRRTAIELANAIASQDLAVADGKLASTDVATAAAVKALTDRQKKLLATTLAQKLETGQLEQKQYDAIVSTYALSNAQGKLGGAIKGVGAFIKANPWMAAVAAIGLVITGITAIKNGIEKAKHVTEEARAELSNLAKEAGSISSEYRELKESADDVIPRFVELAKRVDSLGGKGKLTNEEYAEFLRLNNKLAEMFPSINGGMDSNGNAMLKLSYAAENLEEILSGLIDTERKLANQKAVENLENVAENINKLLNGNRVSRGLFKDSTLDMLFGGKDYNKQLDEFQAKIEAARRLLERINQGALGTDSERKPIINLEDYLITPDIAEVTGLKYEDNIFGRWLLTPIDEAQKKLSDYIHYCDSNINRINSDINSAWGAVNSGATAYAETIYGDLATDLQDAISQFLSRLDFSSLGIEPDAESIKDYVNKIVALFREHGDKIMEVFSSLSIEKALFESGKIDEETYKTFIQNILNGLYEAINDDEFEGVLSSVFDKWFDISPKNNNVSNEIKNEVTDLSEAVSGLKSNYDLLAKAQEEMNNTGSISADTLDKLKSATDNYLDYIYEENGAIKLNTEAWKAYSEAAIKGSINALKAELELKRARRDSLRESLEHVGPSAGMAASGELGNWITARTSELDELNDEIQEGEALLPLYISWLEALGAQADDVDPFTNSNTGYDNIKKSFDALAKAKEEMANVDGDGGISVDTIKQLAAITDDYTQYLYVENGVIKLNTQAWRDYAEAAMAASIADLESNIEDKKAERDGLIEQLRELQRTNPNDESGIQKLTDDISRLNNEIVQDTNNLEIYRVAAENLSGLSFNSPYERITNSFSEVKDVIDNVTGSLGKLADLQAEVANGFTLPRDKALEFAEVFPEILDKAEVTANGELKLNEDVVNNFIKGKEAEIRGNAEAEIKKLEAKKQMYQAVLAYSQAELDLAIAVANGEVSSDAMADKIRAENRDKLVETLIELGVEEERARKMGLEVSMGNYETFDQMVADVANDMATNMGKAAVATANNIHNNINNAKADILSMQRQARKAARAIGNMGTPTFDWSTISDSIEFGSSGAAGWGGVSTNTTSNSLDSFLYDYQHLPAQWWQNYIDSLSSIISDYTNTINNIDGQIAALQALMNASLEQFHSGSTSAGSGSGSGSGSDSGNNGPTWFEQQYKLHQHLLNMDIENMEDYLNWLNEAYQRAYNEGIITLDDYFKYQEEVYNGLKNLFKDYLNDIEHEISMREHFESETQNIVALYRELLEAVEREIAAARARGLDDTDDYIQELLDKWKQPHHLCS